MNLKEIRQEINAALDYNPDLQTYRDVVTRVLNRHYLQLSSQYQWLFMQKTASITFKPDASGSATRTATRDSTDTRKLTFTNFTLPTDMNGQTFIDDSGTEYTITRVLSATELIIDAAGPSGAQTAWTVEYRHYPMPTDCVEVLGVMSRADDRGRLTFIDAKKEELLFLDRDQTGDPFATIESPWLVDPPPDRAPLLSTAPSGTLTIGEEYGYCFTFSYAGRESPPSETVSATVVSGGIGISALPVTTDTTDGVTGRYKYIYRRNKTNGGVWRLLKVVEEAITSQTDEGPLYETETYAATMLLEEGPRQYIRAYYTPSQDRAVEIRYLSRPRRMSNDSETPIWPPQFHHLLVYKSLEDICLQHGMTTHAQLYERRATIMLERMKTKYLSRPDRIFRRRGFDHSLFEQERWGIPSKT